MAKTPQELGIEPPSGGFKKGGWYKGRQYWGGTLSEPGQIHPQSSQKGAGEDVSQETLRQTSEAAGKEPDAYSKYIKEQREQAPKTEEELTSHLNKVQSGLLQKQTSPETQPVAQTKKELKEELTGELDYPEPLDRVKEFEELKTEYGLGSLEKQLNDLKAQSRDVQARLRKRKAEERDKPVATNVIEGRISETERQERENLEFIQRQQQKVADQLNSGYKIVGMYMDFMGQDYQDAVQRYNTEFKQNLQIYDLMRQERKEAKANLQMYANAITEGNMTYDNLSTDQKVDISKLEARAGLPVGFVSNLQMSPSDKLITTNSKTGEALIMDSGGNMKVVQTGMTPTGGGGSDLSESDESEYNQKATNQFLTTHSNDYGHVPPQQYNDARREWINAGEDPDEFDRVFRTYRDPNRTDNAYNVEREKDKGYY